MSNDIRLTYYCRDSVSGISTMARKNGMWNVITMKLYPGSMGWRHFIPLAFVISVIGLGVLSAFYWMFPIFLCFELLLYLTLDIVFSAKAAESAREFFALLMLFPTFHISYGLGSIIGFTKLFSKNRKNIKQTPLNR